jgi:PPM family protein phosphatase
MDFSLHTQGPPERKQRAASARAFEVCGISHRGLIRVHNEDFWFADEKLGLAVVADGVGGQADGALASRAAVDCVAEYLRRATDGFLRATSSAAISTAAAADTSVWKMQERTVARAIGLANRRLVAVNATASDVKQRRGSTIVGLWAPWGADSLATIFHVGDSRIYLLRDGVLKPLTSDHSAYQQWSDSGKRGSPPPKSFILQALGLSNVAPDIRSVSTIPGDRFLLCSDGLTNAIDDGELQAALQDDGSMNSACERLVSLALARGGNDNLTTVLCKFSGDEVRSK